MRYKINFRNLVAGHILLGILLVVALCVMDSARNGFIIGVLSAVALSLLLQVLVYRLRPTWFEDKAKNP
jgi:hypothetical protein